MSIVILKKTKIFFSTLPRLQKTAIYDIFVYKDIYHKKGEHKMVVIGIDFGDARTGFASCDPMQTIASPQGIVKANGIENMIAAAKQKVEELGGEFLVIGCPVNMDGSKGHRAERCMKFAEGLSAATGLEYEMLDERLTTVEAYTYMNITDTKGSKRRNVVDALAAQIILQTWIDMKKRA